ncbi:MAG: DUF3788 family protein [Archangium sp.]|nr:DUF3788 family protein [Archangium sp.]
MPSVFDDKSHQPDDVSLARGLGKATAPWLELVEYLAQLPGVTASWKFYGAKHGWQLKAVQGKRAVLYLVPNAAAFTAALALRPAALEVARATLPPALVREIDAAKPGPEGHPARVLVRTRKDAALVKRLLALKVNG